MGSQPSLAAPPKVRRAGATDLPLLAPMLARAFADDPIAEWVSPDPAARMTMLERFNAARLRHMLPHGEVWMSIGGEATAVWAPPERGGTTPRHELELAASMLIPRLLPRLPMVKRGMESVEAEHRRQPPHYYLAVLGTNPAAQGRGLGAAVLAPVLEQCDRDGIGAYLESSKERNLDYYARFGFQVKTTLPMPNGPPMWGMWRDPR